MRKWIAILALVTIPMLTSPVLAQGTVDLNSVSVEIWPEYDQPAVLVIYRISLASSTSLPAVLNLRVPAGAEVYAVAVSDPTAGLLNAPYERTVNGPWATLKITANRTDIQVEYYDPLVKDGTARHVVYEWAGDYPVAAFSIILQQPIGATDLTIDPPLTQSTVGSDGFVYFTSPSQPLAVNQTYTLTVDYQKSSDTLSTTGLPVQPAQPLNVSTPGRVTVNGVLPWVLGGVGGVLIIVGVVGGVYMWKSKARNRGTTYRHRTVTRQEVESTSIYCPQCGRRAQSSDVFCRNCGTRLSQAE